MKTILFVIIGLLFIITGCQQPVKQIHLEGFAQGTYYNIRYYDPQNRNLQVKFVLAI